MQKLPTSCEGYPDIDHPLKYVVSTIQNGAGIHKNVFFTKFPKKKTVTKATRITNNRLDNKCYF